MARATASPGGRVARGQVLHALAIAFAVIAAGLIIVAIVGMVTGRPGDRAGVVIRVLAVLCFATAVALNVAAH